MYKIFCILFISASLYAGKFDDLFYRPSDSSTSSSGSSTESTSKDSPSPRTSPGDTSIQPEPVDKKEILPKQKRVRIKVTPKVIVPLPNLTPQLMVSIARHIMNQESNPAHPFATAHEEARNRGYDADDELSGDEDLSPAAIELLQFAERLPRDREHIDQSRNSLIFFLMGKIASGTSVSKINQ